MSVSLEAEYDKIYRYCYYKVRNKDVAEDLTQETFLRYFSQSTYISRGKPLAYLYTIAKNLCTDYFRKSGRHEGVEDVTTLPDTAVAATETTLTVRAAVATLSHEEQEIVLLRFANGLSLGEVAQYLGVSRFALYRRVAVITKKLKEQLREEDFDE